MIPTNDSVRLLSQFIEEMDLTDLYSTYSRIRENQVSPRTLLKIMIYGYMNKLYSSRDIENACLVLCQEKVQIKFGQIVFVINMHFLHFLNSTYFHIHLEINIHNGCVFLLYYRMFLYIQKQVYMHVYNLKFYNDLTTLF